MRNDPFGIYRDETLRPTGSGDGGQASGGIGWMIVGVLLGFALLIGWQRFGGEWSDGDRERDQQEERDDRGDRGDDKPPAVKGKTLVFVHERDPQPIEHDLLLRQMDEYVKQRGLDGYRALDDDMTDDQTQTTIAFAKSKGIDPPFVVLTDQNDRPARAIKWPANVDGLAELFK